MNLKSITIENLLSFENSTFDFEKYNVIGRSKQFRENKPTANSKNADDG